MGIETLNDCVSHVSWVNKNIILYHQSPWPWVVPQNCHNQLFSHAEKNNIFCGARLYEFFQVSIQKGLFRIFDSQQSHNRGTPWFLLTLVVILLNGLRQPKKIGFISLPSPHSDCMDAALKYTWYHKGLGDFLPKIKHLWHRDTQLCSWPVRRRPVIVSCA